MIIFIFYNSSLFESPNWGFNWFNSASKSTTEWLNFLFSIFFFLSLSLVAYNWFRNPKWSFFFPLWARLILVSRLFCFYVNLDDITSKRVREREEREKWLRDKTRTRFLRSFIPSTKEKGSRCICSGYPGVGSNPKDQKTNHTGIPAFCYLWPVNTKKQQAAHSPTHTENTYPLHSKQHLFNLNKIYIFCPGVVLLLWKNSAITNDK